jgi:signal recognition particle receptor subunit beta
MERYKFLVSGPVGAGKTAAIDSVSDSATFNTDVNVSDTAVLRKESTTVAMDYGMVVMSNGNKAHIYGTPGQERFDFMWEVLAKGTQGLLLLFDNSRNHPQRDLIYYLSCFSKLLTNVPFVIGVTRMDIKRDPPLDAYRQWLKALKIDAPVVKVDAREKSDVLFALEMLAKKIETSSTVEAQTRTSSVNASVNKDIAETQRAISSDQSSRYINHSASHNEAKIDHSKNSHPIPVESHSSTALNHQGLLFSDEVLSKVQQLQGVTGVMLSDDMGEVLHSSIEDEQIIDFAAFLASATPIIEEALAMGSINRVTLKSAQDDNLNFFLEKEQSLTIASNRRTSIPVLTQQVEDVLQWG